MVKRQEGGVLLVELFESEGPSLNVQLLKMDGVQLDESQRPLICFSTSAGSDSSCLSQTASNLPVTSNQSFSTCAVHIFKIGFGCLRCGNKTNIHSTLQVKTILVAMVTKSLELVTKLEPKSPAWRLKLGRKIESVSLI